MRAYLGEGALMSDRATLERLAAELCLDAGAARNVLTGDAYAADVRADEETVTSLGITAVPFFVVNREIAVSGAQQPEILAALLQRALPALR